MAFNNMGAAYNRARRYAADGSPAYIFKVGADRWYVTRYRPNRGRFTRQRYYAEIPPDGGHWQWYELTVDGDRPTDFTAQKKW